MAMSSQYYRDLSKVEKKIKGISIRSIKAYFFLFLVCGVLVLEVFFLPDWLFLLLSVPTAFILGYPPILMLLNRWREKKRKIQLLFMYEDSEYCTNQIRRYKVDEFIQDENIKETDIV